MQTFPLERLPDYQFYPIGLPEPLAKIPLRRSQYSLPPIEPVNLSHSVSLPILPSLEALHISNEPTPTYLPPILPQPFPPPSFLPPTSTLAEPSAYYPTAPFIARRWSSEDALPHDLPSFPPPFPYQSPYDFSQRPSTSPHSRPHRALGWAEFPAPRNYPHQPYSTTLFDPHSPGYRPPPPLIAIPTLNRPARAPAPLTTCFERHLRNRQQTHPQTTSQDRVESVSDDEAGPNGRKRRRRASETPRDEHLRRFICPMCQKTFAR
ncbi:hypothetical protein P7C70_g1496, partial [Phenoliferia sp. Uapishka_3]